MLLSYLKGTDVLTPAGVVRVKAAAILSGNDLRARAYLMNQTQHNGGGGGAPHVRNPGRLLSKAKEIPDATPIVKSMRSQFYVALQPFWPVDMKHISGIRVRLSLLIMTYDITGHIRVAISLCFKMNL